jgi:hypothetical protein
MADQFIFSAKDFVLQHATSVWAYSLCPSDMNCSDMALEIGLPPKWLPIATIISRAYKRVDVDVVEMIFEKLGGLVSSLRCTIVPSTFLRRLPGVADVVSMMFCMKFGFFHRVEGAFGRALWPVALRISCLENFFFCYEQLGNRVTKPYWCVGDQRTRAIDMVPSPSTLEARRNC